MPSPSSFSRLASVMSWRLASLGADTPLSMRLAEEMASRWRHGERPLAEEFIDRHPELWQQPEAAMQLIYEEICLRQEHGEPDAAAVVARFPPWRPSLEALLACHDLLGAGPPDRVPAVGDTLGEYRLVAELGRGGGGAVFLAVEPALAGRPVVLKLTPRAGQEHLSLARLQHTHIVPLYTARDDLARDLRLLCMPYFGGTSMARLLTALADVPPARRTGRHLLDALDAATAELPVPAPARGPGRDRLARADFAQAMCWIGACLADALHYAHERGLVHLDIKPANVLLAADGTPMLLDFHLAREPLAAGAAPREWLGGTPLFMAPEQAAGVAALSRGEVVPAAVDARADIFALGLMLYLALGGRRPVDLDGPADLSAQNAQVSPGLADVISRCLARDPRARYPDAAALADDLRRHLADEPLRGVPNRSLTERWRKWRRRRPYALTAVGVFLAVAGALALAGDHVRGRYAEPRADLRAGLALLQEGDAARAGEVLARGRARAAGLPFCAELTGELDAALAACEQARAAQRRAETARDLHALAQRIRFAAGLDPLPAAQAADLAARCRVVWRARLRLWDVAGQDERVRADLLDVAVIGAGLEVRLAPADEADAARRGALALLDEAEALCGPGPLLDQERARHGGTRSVLARPRNTWEAVCLGRSLLQAGEVKRAAELFGAAVEQSPGDFWAQFYHGLCAHRLGQHRLAAERFGVCVALAPASAACYHNRALARTALGETDAALEDYTRALALDPALADAAFNRAQLHAKQGRAEEARRDLEEALRRGADPAAAHYQLAVLALAAKDRAAADASLRRALAHDPNHAAARELLGRLQQERPR